MRSLATSLKHNQDEWGLAGLAHDIDINDMASDMTRHGVAGAGVLTDMGAPAAVVHAVRSHDDRANSPRTAAIDHALFCANQGYWFALASRRGEPPADRRNKLAAGCGALGLTLEKVLDICERAIRSTTAGATPSLSPAPAGPYRVAGNRILDAQGRAYLVRGTQFPLITIREADIRGDGVQFGAFSPSSFVTVRHRANMNAARFPVDAGEYTGNARYRARVQEVVRAANRFELLAILESAGSAEFWARLATDYKDNPNVLLAAPPEAVAAVRSAGMTQALIVASPEVIGDGNVIYQVTPRYASLRTGERPWRHLAERAPVLVNDLDPKLDEASAECAAFPGDPGAASALLEELLSEFDERSISWTLSSFRPGRLITDYRFYNWKKLDDGWVCGQSPSWSGIGIALLSHLWRTDPHEVFAVAQQRGGFQIARGAVGAVYGRILAEREMQSAVTPLPRRLGNISIRVRDSAGVARLAPLISTGAGWSYTTFVVPSDTAVGPAEIAVVRSDGTESKTRVVITDVSPALWTATHDGRGPVIGHVVGRGAAGGRLEEAAWECLPEGCRTTPIGLAGPARVRLEGTGFRYAGDRSAIRVTVDDVAAPVLSFGAMKTPGRDYLLIELPRKLRGRGETDLVVRVRGEISNVARIHCGT